MAMRTIEEIQKIVKMIETIRANQGRFWLTCRNEQFEIDKEYSEGEFDKVRARFLDSSKYPVQVLAHWGCKIGDEFAARSKLLHPQRMNYETESDRDENVFTVKKGLLEELAAQIVSERPKMEI